MNQITTRLDHSFIYASFPFELDQPRTPAVLVVDDGTELTGGIRQICDFLGVEIEKIESANHLRTKLSDRAPMAVIAGLDTEQQDGFHVLKLVASYDRTLPVLLVTGNDPAMAGAADAIEQLWELTSVKKTRSLPGPGELVEFLCTAGQQGACLGLMPI